MNAGTLDQRIIIRRAYSSANAFNEPIATWSDLVTVRAGRRDASASESYRAQQVGAEISTRFTIRWSSQVADVSPLDRLACDGRDYNITAVRDVGRRLWREIDAVARSEG
jgi:SPP1 family predicted phage head-tail adaptor